MHPQRVLHESRPRMAQPVLPQVPKPAVKIQDLATVRIEHQRIDREIPTARRLLRGDRRIKLHFESAMPRPDLRIPPREREVVLLPVPEGELHHPERTAHRVDPTPPGQRPEQHRVIDTEHLDVEVLHRSPKLGVPHAPSHQKGTRQFRRSGQDLPETRWQQVDQSARCSHSLQPQANAPQGSSKFSVPSLKPEESGSPHRT